MLKSFRATRTGRFAEWALAMLPLIAGIVYVENVPHRWLDEPTFNAFLGTWIAGLALGAVWQRLDQRDLASRILGYPIVYILVIVGSISQSIPASSGTGAVALVGVLGVIVGLAVAEDALRRRAVSPEA